MPSQREIGVEPRESAVTVGERMDEDEPMVHADCVLDRRICPMVQPVARVVKEYAQLDAVGSIFQISPTQQPWTEPRADSSGDQHSEQIPCCDERCG
jgi:hypothetical protein